METSGRITWKSESRKLAGIEFVNLSDVARSQIKEWISLESLPAELREPVAAVPSQRTETQSSAVASDAVLRIPKPASERPTIVPSLKEIAGVESSPTQPTATLPGAPNTDRFRPPSGLTLTGGSIPTRPKEASVSEDNSRSTRALVALFAFLAIMSLIVGWAAGRLGLKRFFPQAKMAISATNVNQVPARAPSASPAVKVSEIEIQDLNNRSHLIPFDGPLPPDGATAQHGAYPPVRSQGSAPVVTTDIPSGLTIDPPGSTRALPDPGSSAEPSSPRGVGVLQRGRLIHRVEPLYPSLALESQIEGTVKLHAVIGEDGSVRTLESVSGPDELLDSAMNAVHQWRYTPTILDGKPIETDQDIFIVFRLPPPKP